MTDSRSLPELLDDYAERAPRTHLSNCATTADWYYGGTSACDCGEPKRVSTLIAALRAVLDEADKAEHGATRWAEPLPVPEWVGTIRAAITEALEKTT